MDAALNQAIEELASRYGVSTHAVMALLQALKVGEGTMAQFDHPELGGLGQWSRGGMTMVGDMFNDDLKAKVNGLASDLSRLLGQGRTDQAGATVGLSFPAKESSLKAWWGADFGQLSATGSQNDIRYAYFAATRRLAIKTDNELTIYDTADHAIRGVSQQQSGPASITFVSQYGVIPVDTLRVVERRPS
jgi:hypothetical protein